MNIDIDLKDIKEIANSNLVCAKTFKILLKEKEDVETGFEKFILELNYYVEFIRNDKSNFESIEERLQLFLKESDSILYTLMNKLHLIGNSHVINKQEYKSKLVMSLNRIITQLNNILILKNNADNKDLLKLEQSISNLHELFEEVKRTVI